MFLKGKMLLVNRENREERESSANLRKDEEIIDLNKVEAEEQEEEQKEEDDEAGKEKEITKVK